jgi:hypothetical protein
VASAYAAIASPTAARSAQLARLAYELLDPYCDTERLVRRERG